MTASVRHVPSKKVAPTLVRCAIYTRKSSEEGLEQEFNSLDAQRESGEAYITSMKHEGWVCLPDRYDDGGYTGGNTERPALKKLLKDIDAGRVDTVVVYKVDRLSRSLLDFSRMMETFERRHVSFVSVTQQFNTTQSMGRLTLNILLSFAQFERELVSERTRDKIAAARRKGKWSGGRPILGYDIVKGKLVVNEAEAQQVRAIFELYIANESLIRTARELNGRGWRTKQWTSAAGATMGGAVWDKVRLWHLLVNVAYLGKVRHHADVYPGEHSAIIEESLFRRAQEFLVHNGRTSGSEVRNVHGALLKSLLHCARCKRLMGHVFTCKQKTQYRYYKCHAAQKGGVAVCPLGCIPAEQVESFVVEQLRRVFRDPDLMSRTLEEARRGHSNQLAALAADEATAARHYRRLEAEAKRAGNAARANVGDPDASARFGEVLDELRDAEQRLSELRARRDELAADIPQSPEVAEAVDQFTGMWESLTPRERARVVHLLVKKVTYDGDAGKIRIEFHPNGLAAVAAPGGA